MVYSSAARYGGGGEGGGGEEEGKGILLNPKSVSIMRPLREKRRAEPPCHPYWRQHNGYSIIRLLLSYDQINGTFCQ